ncbi:zinc ABC transporter substrate-binding protein [Candidatus Sumerlaeota bacterium]|nr:zinc ABC transporter substrate-binding protein [Candidatus Sumerlaeota bacterium]
MSAFHFLPKSFRMQGVIAPLGIGKRVQELECRSFRPCFSAATLVVSLVFCLLAHSASAKAGESYYAVTIQPLGMIVAELVKGRADVVTIIPPGASPHTFEPRPSDARKASDAAFLFSVSENLDGWVAKLPAGNSLHVMDLLPESARREFPESTRHDDPSQGHDHGHGVVDPHFWTDPLTVAALLPPLVAKLCEIDPDGAATYRANGQRFAEELRRLDAEAEKELKPMKGRAVFLFHPSFLYLLDRHGLVYAGSVEEMPGKEGSPRKLIAIIKTVREKQIPVIFTEPQFPRAAAEVIARDAGVKLAELDPTGGVPGRMTYAEWFRHNIAMMSAAYQ